LSILGAFVVLAAVGLNARSNRWVPDAEAKVAAARAKQLAADLEALEESASDSPDDFAAQMNAAKSLAKHERLLPACRFAERAVALKPDSAEARLLLGMIYAPLDYSTRAETEYRKALALAPAHLETYQRLSDLLLAQGRRKEAESLLKEAIRRAPEAVGPRLSLASLLSDVNPSAVLETLDSVLAADSAPVAALYLAGKACQSSGQTRRAAELLDRAIHIAPDFADAHHALGSVLSNEGRFSEGLIRLAKAVELNPGNPTYHYALANALRSDRSRPENLALARREFETAIELNPRDAFAHYYYGAVLEEQGEAAAAEREYERTLEVEPTFFSARHRLGALLKAQGRTAEGEKHLAIFAREARRSITEVHGGRRDRTFVDTAEAHYQRALDYTSKGERELAIRSLQLAVDRDPGHAGAQAALRRVMGGS
jgi:tetratricopeptide (TPR) repeat protein